MKKLCLILLLLPFYSFSQVINTVAGNGIAAFGGDGGSALSASLYRPISCITDPAGNLYISDFTNSRIRKVSPAGIITTIAGTGIIGMTGDGGPAVAARISTPEKLTLDAAGNLFFCDFDNNKIRKINTAGIITTVAGTGVVGVTGDGGPATNATLWRPSGIALDAAGNIYIADQWNNRIRKVNTSGIISTIAGFGAVGLFMGGFSGDGGPSTAAQINFPVGIIVTPSGEIVFTDCGNQRLRKISTTGIISTIAGTGVAGYGGDGGPALSAQFNNPEGLADDASGNFYICELSGNRVRKINPAGIITTLAGTGVAGFSGDGGAAFSANVHSPEGISVDPVTSCVYICDALNNRVRSICPGVIGNNPPHFIHGPVDSILICGNEVYTPYPIDSLLATLDLDVSQTITWSPLLNPAHGTLIASASTTSTGGILYPAGFLYTPTAGFMGTDLFKVRVTDGLASDTITIIVNLLNTPNVSSITGVDTICTGHSTAYTNSGAGGVWSSSNSAIATVSSTGVVNGIARGLVTISYVLSNLCGTASATKQVYINTCVKTAVNTYSINKSNLLIYPNPSSGNFSATINSAHEGVAKLRIKDITGKIIAEYSLLTNQQKQIQIDVAQGIYIAEVITDSGTYNEKLIISK